MHMQTLLVSINKGGVGKSTIAGQLARYASSLGLRVLMIDLDDQGNFSQGLIRTNVNVLKNTITQVLKGELPEFNGAFDLLPADGKVTAELVERARLKTDQDGVAIEIATLAHQNFSKFLESAKSHYDICIIDGPPALDTRVTMALALASHVICPIQLSQESIEGMASTLNASRGILRIKGTTNPKLDFLGFLPNMVESTPKQKTALADLSESLGKHFLRDNDCKLMVIPKRECIRQAQGLGVSLASMTSTNNGARETWWKLRNVFDVVLDRMGYSVLLEDLKEKQDLEQQAAKQKAKLAKLYGPDSQVETDDIAVIEQTKAQELTGDE